MGCCYANSFAEGGYFFERTRAAMVGLQGLWGERFGGAILDEFSLRRACSAAGESVLEEFLCGCWVDSCSACRATGESVLEVYFWMAFGNAEVVSPSWAPR